MNDQQDNMLGKRPWRGVRITNYLPEYPAVGPHICISTQGLPNTERKCRKLDGEMYVL